MSVQQSAYVVTWVVNVIYLCGVIPQIVLNYRRKSTSGLSDLMLLGYISGYLAEAFYVFSLDMPSSYRTLLPIATVGVYVLIVQRFFYAGYIRLSYVLFGLMVTSPLVLACAIKRFAHFGYEVGWVSMVLFTVYAIPQVMKNYQRKSVEGLSFLYVCIMSFAAISEYASALLLNLPLPTIINGARGALFTFVFFAQFARYGKKRDMNN